MKRTLKVNTIKELREEHLQPSKRHVRRIILKDTISNERPKNLAGLFCGFHNLRRIDGLENLKTEQAISMYSMFARCFKLKKLDLSSFDTSRCQNMASMFWGCKNLQQLTYADWAANSESANTEGMFTGCRYLSA